jgi:hypothetical protein
MPKIISVSKPSFPETVFCPLSYRRVTRNQKEKEKIDREKERKREKERQYSHSAIINGDV